MIEDWYVRTQPTVSEATSGLVVLGAIGKQVEQAIRSEPVSIPPPWPLLQFLPLGFCFSQVPALAPTTGDL